VSDYQAILVERSETGILRITLNRPEKKNAINDQMWDELGQVLRGLRRDESVRVVVITGAGDGFCSGADLSPRDDAPRPHILAKMRQVTDIALLLQGLPQPTIAAVNGVAAGAGCNLALGCDLIVASDSARFSEIFARRGLSIDFGGTWLLPRLVGLHRAKELALFADVIDATEAERIGLVNRVVPASELADFVTEWATRLSAMAPIALAQSKALLNRSIGPGMGEALDAEGAAQAVNVATADAREALEAFRDRREPKFTGR